MLTFPDDPGDDIDTQVADFAEFLEATQFVVVTTLRGTSHIFEVTVHNTLPDALAHTLDTDDGPIATEVHPTTATL